MKWSQWNYTAPLWRQSCFPCGSAGKNLPGIQEIQETRVRSLGGEDPLEKEMATHPSILAWRIPWTEELNGLQSMGLQRIGHNQSQSNWVHMHVPVVVIHSLSRIWLFVTPWTAARQTSLSFIISCNFLKLMSIESVMPSNHLILCCPLLLSSLFPSIRVFFSESAVCIRWPKYWSFSFSISPSNEYSWLISFSINWFELCIKNNKIPLNKYTLFMNKWSWSWRKQTIWGKFILVYERLSRS